MRELYRRGDVQLKDVAAWLVEWSFHKLELDVLLRDQGINGSAAEFVQIVQLG